MPIKGKRVMVFGASGTIGQACMRVLAASGYEVVGVLRDGANTPELPTGTEWRFCDVTKAESVTKDAFRGQSFDVILSCLASRTGDETDAWRIDHQANMHILDAAKTNGVEQMILLSAICVQKPQLPFQHAKLAFEKVLIESGLRYSIVRPTAFFKSLSGQIERVQGGKPFLLFGNGTLTACKPVSDDDLARFIADCIDDPAKQNAILPIGGKGPAITPLEQGHMLFDLTERTPRFRSVPVWLMDAIIAALSMLGRFSKAAKAKANYARIGRYYATESMLLLNPESGEYDADATPETGSETLRAHYQEQLPN